MRWGAGPLIGGWAYGDDWYAPLLSCPPPLCWTLCAVPPLVLSTRLLSLRNMPPKPPFFSSGAAWAPTLDGCWREGGRRGLSETSGWTRGGRGRAYLVAERALGGASLVNGLLTGRRTGRRPSRRRERGRRCGVLGVVVRVRPAALGRVGRGEDVEGGLMDGVEAARGRKEGGLCRQRPAEGEGAIRGAKTNDATQPVVRRARKERLRQPCESLCARGGASADVPGGRGRVSMAGGRAEEVRVEREAATSVGLQLPPPFVGWASSEGWSKASRRRDWHHTRRRASVGCPAGGGVSARSPFPPSYGRRRPRRGTVSAVARLLLPATGRTSVAPRRSSSRAAPSVAGRALLHPAAERRVLTLGAGRAPPSARLAQLAAGPADARQRPPSLAETDPDPHQVRPQALSFPPILLQG